MLEEALIHLLMQEAMMLVEVMLQEMPIHLLTMQVVETMHLEGMMELMVAMQILSLMVEMMQVQMGQRTLPLMEQMPMVTMQVENQHPMQQ